MPKVLVLAYYFPPLGLSGVQRTLKFVKYLPHYGWQPVVVTAAPRGYLAFDPSLLSDAPSHLPILRTPSLDPLALFGRGSPDAAGHGIVPREALRQGLARAAKALFLPDNKLGWLPFAVRAGTAAIRAHRPQVLFSTAPPPTSHLAAALIKGQSRLPLVLDFRDLWSDNPFEWHATPLHRGLNRTLERLALRAADAMVAIHEPMLAALQTRAPRRPERRDRVISHGYDPEDFTDVKATSRDRFTVTYAGTFIEGITPEPFLRALADLVRQHPAWRSRIHARFLGLPRTETVALVKALGLGDLVTIEGYLAHRHATAALVESHLLWLTVPPDERYAGVCTSKLYEYLGARRPILALVPEGVAASVIRAAGAGRVVAPHDVAGIAAALEAFYKAWKQRRLKPTPEAAVRPFDRRRLAGELAALFDELAGGSSR